MIIDGSARQPIDYLRVVRRHKLSIVAVVIAAAGLALGISLAQDPVYEATAQVLVRQPGTTSLFPGNAALPLDPSRVLQTEIRVIKGPVIEEAVKTALNVPEAPKVSVTAVAVADIIQISARDGNREATVAAANGFAKAYIDLRRQQAMDEVLSASREIQARIIDLQGQIDKTSGTERDALVQAQAVFRQKLGEAQVDGSITTGGAGFVAPATLPSGPISPKPLRNVIWAMSSALGLAVGAAFLRDYLDNTIRTIQDLERTDTGLAPAGLIPLVPDWKTGETPRPLTLDDSHSASAEAFRTLRTSIQFISLERKARTIQITSPSSGEGKTTIVANLGVALAQAGQRVVIICCDLRRPRLHTFFGLENEEGLSSVMLRQTSLSKALRRVDDHVPLYVLPSGPTPPNPSELLASKRTADIFLALRKVSDIIILDCPPILPVADSLIVSSYADASLIVCRAGKTSHQKIARAVELMRQVNAPLAGTILNGVTAQDTENDSYEYYGPQDRATS